MRFLTMWMRQIRQTLEGMNTSSKVALVLLVILVGGCLFWLTYSYAAKPELVPVFSAPLADEQLGQAKTLLQRGDIPAELENGRILVPVDRQEEAYALLAYESLTPSGSSADDLQKMLLEPSMFTAENQNVRLWHEAKQAKLSKLIAQFPHVRSAQVIVERGQPRKLGSPEIPGSASVTLTLKPGQSMSRKITEAVADLVSGAFAGLDRSQVRIVADGRSYRVSEEDDFSGRMLEEVAELERHYSKKIVDVLSIADLRVSVNIIPDTTVSASMEEVNYDEPVVAKVASAMENAEGMGQPAGEPGVRPNTGARIPTGVARGMKSESEEAASAARFPTEVIRKQVTGEIRKEITATVNVPLNHLVRTHKMLNGEETDPVEADLQAMMARIREKVKGAIGVKEDALVTVDWYVDTAPVIAMEPAQAGIGTMFASYGKQAALAVLAMAALVMVMMFARRRYPPPPEVEVTPPLGELVDRTVNAIEGEEGALEGMELDDETIRVHKIIEQIGQLVREKPDAATTLIQRWINKT